MVALEATGPLDRNALLVGVLRCVNQRMLDSTLDEFKLEHKFYLLEACERIIRSPQLSGAAQQVIRNTRIDLSKTWLRKNSILGYWWNAGHLERYIAKIRSIHPTECGHYERIDILRVFGPSTRQVLSFHPDNWIISTARFLFVETFNKFVQEVDQTSRRMESNARRVRDPNERWCHWEDKRASISPIYSIPPDPPESDWAKAYADLKTLYSPNALESMGIDDIWG
ncbi:hypothetical protein FS837_004486 [Tulasnella sp. UAMH 9824]|nr:hypothetical protein FS837_004486 [Tulasnella sp. UAMH 9824]